MNRWIAILGLLLATSWATPGSAATATPASDTAHAIIQRMLALNPLLTSYRSRVHVNVRMLNFPFLAPKLKGTTYFLRPNNYEVVFDRVPRYAKGFSRLFNDVGDAARWENAHDVSFEGVRSLHGRPMLALRLTKKVHSTILDHATAYIDARTFELVEMKWDYTSGGTITMTQRYREEGGFTVLASQHATIDIPHVHAIADSTYAVYQTNVALAPSVFEKQ